MSQAAGLFDELFVQGIQNPDAIEAECDAVVSQLRSAAADSRRNVELLAGDQELDADDARKWRDHPVQFWLERAITTGLPGKGGAATKDGDTWRLRWMDGSESVSACFDARTAASRPDVEWVTLEDARARAVIGELPRCVDGQPLPVIEIAGLPDAVRGVWSLWEIGLSAEDFGRRRFLAVFVTDEGRTFMPTASRIWDLLVTERIRLVGLSSENASGRWFHDSKRAAVTNGERVFAELAEEHAARVREERDRACHAYEARHQAIGRIGLPSVREYRRRRLRAEHETRMARLDAAEICGPDLHSLLTLRVGSPVGNA